MPRVGDKHFPYTPAGYADAAKARGYSNGGPAGMRNPFERIPPFTPAPVHRPAPIAPPIGRAPPPPMLVRPTPIPAQAQNPSAPVAPAGKTDTARKVDIIWNKLFADNKPKDKSDLGYKPNRPKAPMNRQDPRFTVTGGPGFGIPGFNEGGTIDIDKRDGKVIWTNSDTGRTWAAEPGWQPPAGWGPNWTSDTGQAETAPPVNPLYAQALAGGADINGDGTISEAEFGAWRPADARYGVGHGGRHLNADNVSWLRDNQGVPVQADGSIAEADFINWARENDRHGTGVNRAAWDAGADTDNSGLLSSEELYSWNPSAYQEPPPSATAEMTTMQNPYVFGGYGAPPSMPYAGMATPQIPSIMGMAPPSYYGGSAQPDKGGGS